MFYNIYATPPEGTNRFENNLFKIQNTLLLKFVPIVFESLDTRINFFDRDVSIRISTFKRVNNVCRVNIIIYNSLTFTYMAI